MKPYLQTVCVVGLLALVLSGCAANNGADSGYGAQLGSNAPIEKAPKFH